MVTGIDIERIRKYEKLLRTVCGKYGEDPYLWAALMLRESGAGYAAPYWPKGTHLGWGDGSTEAEPTKGYGFGLFQIDRRFHAVFLSSAAAKTPEGQLKYAIELHQSNVAYQKKYYPEGNEKFWRRAALAAYNCGNGGVIKSVGFHFPEGTADAVDVDKRTAGANYSKWILTKAEEIKKADLYLFTPGEPANGPRVPAANPWLSVGMNIFNTIFKK